MVDVSVSNTMVALVASVLYSCTLLVLGFSHLRSGVLVASVLSLGPFLGCFYSGFFPSQRQVATSSDVSSLRGVDESRSEEVSVVTFSTSPSRVRTLCFTGSVARLLSREYDSAFL